MPLTWKLDGTKIDEVLKAELEWNRLRLTIRATASHVSSTLSPLDAHAGAVDEQVRSDGVYKSSDQSPTSGGNTVTITPPSGVSGVVGGQQDYRVLDYDRRPLDQQGDRFQVNVAFAPAQSNSLGSAGQYPDESVASGEWEIALERSTVATDRVDQDLRQAAAQGIADVAPTVYLESNEAEAVTDHFSKVDSVNNVEVKDADDRVEDQSGDSRQTVDITPPNTVTSETFATATYINVGWTATIRTDAIVPVKLRLAERTTIDDDTQFTSDQNRFRFGDFAGNLGTEIGAATVK
jgi:hypothetical protein